MWLDEQTCTQNTQNSLPAEILIPAGLLSMRLEALLGIGRLENTCNIESNTNLIPGQAPSNVVFIFWIYLSLQRKRFLWARSGHNPGRLQRLHQLITSKICAIIIIWIDASSILLEVTSRSQLDPSCLEMWLSSADLTTIYSLQLRGE